jgi:hypothetical protein
MVIEMLPELITAIRAAAMANDNAPAATRPAAAADADAEPVGPPLVRNLRRRPGMSYARSGNVILPLQFAERMRGWHAPARYRPRNQVDGPTAPRAR